VPTLQQVALNKEESVMSLLDGMATRTAQGIDGGKALISAKNHAPFSAYVKGEAITIHQDSTLEDLMYKHTRGELAGLALALYSAFNGALTACEEQRNNKASTMDYIPPVPHENVSIQKLINIIKKARKIHYEVDTYTPTTGGYKLLRLKCGFGIPAELILRDISDKEFKDLYLFLKNSFAYQSEAIKNSINLNGLLDDI